MKTRNTGRVQRCLALCLALCLLLTGLPAAAFSAGAEETPALTVSAAEVSGAVGEIVRVPVTYAHGADYALTSATVTVTYDAAALTPVAPRNAAGEEDWELAAGEALQYALCQVDASVAGRLVIAFVTAGTLTAGEGTLIELPFLIRAQAAGRNVLSVAVGKDIGAVRLVDHEEITMQAAAHAGRVQVARTAEGLCGDVNGDGAIDTADAVLVLQYAAELIGATDLDTAPADVNRDGTIDTADAVLILQYAAELIDRFPGDGGSTTDPTTPTEPSKPTDPSEPVKPTDPTEPVKPTDPTDPIEPVTPTDPSEPVKPTDPTEPTEPATTTTTATAPTYPPFEDSSRDPQVGDINTGYAFLNPDWVGDKEGAEEQNVFKKFLLCKEDNVQLPYSISLYISRGQKAVTALVPSGVDLTSLVPRFTYDGTVTLYGREIRSGVDALDFSKKFQLVLTDKKGRQNTLVIKVMTIQTGLPSFTATTNDLEEVGWDKSPKGATFTLGGGDRDKCFYAPGDNVMTVSGQIKGRGNTSWGQEKKSYTLKFDEKRKVLDMDKSKDWVLVAAHEDYSQLRNLLGQYLGEAAGVSYTLKVRPVDFWYNGRYWGTYSLIQKVEIEGSRVNITKYEPNCGTGNTGFLLEFDGHVSENASFRENPDRFRLNIGDGYEVYYNDETDELFFPLSIGGKWLTIKKPSYTKYLINDTAQIRYIYDYVYAAMAALKEHRSYEEVCRYIDVESFTNWYIVEEFMNNCDSSFHSSCYMTLDVGGRLKMGPVWDFDRSSDNCNYWNPDNEPDSLRRSGAAWFCYLYGDGESKPGYDEARAVLKQRWQAFYENTATLNRTVDEWAELIEDSVELNFKRWNVLGAEDDGHRNKPIGSNTERTLTATTFEGQVAILRNYFTERRRTMNRSINEL